MSESMDACIFCKIAARELPASIVVETGNVVAFDDIAPQAPVHVQVIPKQHLSSVREVGPNNDALWAELLDVANRVARLKGVDQTGYRLSTNSGPDSGQEVLHLHIHVLGGRSLGRMA